MNKSKWVEFSENRDGDEFIQNVVSDDWDVSSSSTYFYTILR